jgi:glutamine cyclotransferase
MRAVRFLTAVLAVLVAGGCDSGGSGDLHVDIVAVRPHDRTAFTEGLEIDDGVLFEGTGISGKSGLRASDLKTGAELNRVELPAPLFGEGIAVSGGSLWQLTWRDRIAIERDPRTLAERRRVYFVGEGWGLCAQAGRLVMSDGSSTLTFRDPSTFERIGSITLDGHDGARLNELDCAEDGSVYANVWPTDKILRIDPATGAALAEIDAKALRDRVADTPGIDVLNGVAHIPGTDRFLLAGKNWPDIFEVRFGQ